MRLHPLILIALLLPLFPLFGQGPQVEEWNFDLFTKHGENLEENVRFPKSRIGLDRTSFLSGEQLHGSFQGLTADQLLHWKRADVEEVIELRTPTIETVDLHRPEMISSSPLQLELINGDTFVAEILSSSPDACLLKTGFGGELTLQRHALKNLTVRKNAVFLGISEFRQWSQPNGTVWSFSEGKLISHRLGIIERDGIMKDKVAIDLEVRLPRHTTMQMQMFHRIKEGIPEGYHLILANGYVGLNRRRAAGGQEMLGDAHLSQHDFQDYCTVGLRVDRSEKRFVLMINGKKVADWKEKEEFAGKGSGFGFSDHTGGGVEIRNFSMAPWDGSSIRSLVPTVSSNVVEDVIIYANGDRLSCSVKAMDAEGLTTQAHGSVIKAPWREVSKVMFGKKKEDRDRLTFRRIRAHLATGGQLTLNLESASTKSLKGKNDSFGKIELALNHINRIQFNMVTKDEEEFGDPFSEDR